MNQQGEIAVVTDTVVISKAEYAELLRYKASALDGGAQAGGLPPFVKELNPWQANEHPGAQRNRAHV